MPCSGASSSNIIIVTDKGEIVSRADGLGTNHWVGVYCCVCYYMSLSCHHNQPYPRHIKMVAMVWGLCTEGYWDRWCFTMHDNVYVWER